MTKGIDPGQGVRVWSLGKLAGLEGKVVALGPSCLGYSEAWIARKGKQPLLEKASQELRFLCVIRRMKFSSSKNSLFQPRIHIAFCASKAINPIGIL